MFFKRIFMSFFDYLQKIMKKKKKKRELKHVNNNILAPLHVNFQKHLCGFVSPEKKQLHVFSLPLAFRYQDQYIRSLSRYY